jgi:DNA-binding transcriptional LysR family regulator
MAQFPESTNRHDFDSWNGRAGVTFSLTELAILVGLAEGKTLTAIAQHLYLGQPAISKALRVAEQRIGLRLAAHSGRRVRLTALGEDMARKAQRVMNELDDLDRFVQQLHAGAAGPLRLISTANPANFVLPGVMGAFAREFPEVEFELRTQRFPDIWPVCLDEAYDIGIGPAAMTLQPLRTRGWDIEELYEDQVTFFVGPESHLASHPALHWDDIHDEMIVGPFTEPYWSEVWERLHGLGFSGSRLMTLRGADAVKRFVEAGTGIGMHLRTALLPELHEGRLVPLQMGTPPPTALYVSAIRPNPRPLPILRVFHEFLHSRLAGLKAQLAAERG